jgi:hypothetical protein
MCLGQMIFHMIQDQLDNNLIPEPLASTLRSKMA